MPTTSAAAAAHKFIYAFIPHHTDRERECVCVTYGVSSVKSSLSQFSPLTHSLTHVFLLLVIVLLKRNEHVQSIYLEMAWFRCLLFNGGAHLIMGMQ